MYSDESVLNGSPCGFLKDDFTDGFYSGPGDCVVDGPETQTQMIWEYIGTLFFGIIAFIIGFAAGRIHEKRHGKQST